MGRISATVRVSTSPSAPSTSPTMTVPAPGSQTSVRNRTDLLQTWVCPPRSGREGRCAPLPAPSPKDFFPSNPKGRELRSLPLEPLSAPSIVMDRSRVRPTRQPAKKRGGRADHACFIHSYGSLLADENQRPRNSPWRDYHFGPAGALARMSAPRPQVQFASTRRLHRVALPG
jgi:hypothetical protein